MTRSRIIETVYDSVGSLILRKTDGKKVTVPLSSGGGSGSVVRKFPFSFNTPNLEIGAPLYTPTVGDILLDAWIEIIVPWNGTTPQGDVGTFIVTPGGGFFSFRNTAPFAVDMTIADFDGTSGVLMSGVQNSGGGLNTIASLMSVSLSAQLRVVPAKFIAPNPIKICVSQTGLNDGSDPGATQGAASLYLVTATPV